MFLTFFANSSNQRRGFHLVVYIIENSFRVRHAGRFRDLIVMRRSVIYLTKIVESNVLKSFTTCCRLRSTVGSHFSPFLNLSRQEGRRNEEDPLNIQHPGWHRYYDDTLHMTPSHQNKYSKQQETISIRRYVCATAFEMAHECVITRTACLEPMHVPIKRARAPLQDSEQNSSLQAPTYKSAKPADIVVPTHKTEL